MKNTGCRLPNDAYIFRMTDDTGMFQHARYTVPDPSKGYTTDDNARALIMAVMFFEATRKQKYLDLIALYLSFLLIAQSGTCENRKTKPQKFRKQGRRIAGCGDEGCYIVGQLQIKCQNMIFTLDL